MSSHVGCRSLETGSSATWTVSTRLALYSSNDSFLPFSFLLQFYDEAEARKYTHK